MQRDFCRQTCLQAAESMGPFALEAASRPALLRHGLHARASARPPAAVALGPRQVAVARRRAEALGARGPPPGLVVGVPLAALGDAIRSPGREAPPRQARVGRAPEGNARRRQGGLCGAGRPTAAARAPPPGGDRPAPRAAVSPAPPGAPAPRGPARQPAGSAALGRPRWAPGALAGGRGTARRHPEPDARPHQRSAGRGRRADLPRALLPGGPSRAGGLQRTLGSAVTAARTAHALPRPVQSPGHPRPPAQGGRWSWGWRRGQRSLAPVVCHHVKRREAGVHSDPSMGSVSWGRESNATGQRHLPSAIRGQLTPSVEVPLCRPNWRW